MNNCHHILVVDDDPLVRSLLRQGFEGAGYVVSGAGSKAMLLRRLSSEHVDLITLDLELGKENGLELAREIRAKRNLPIIMITGKGAPDDRIEGLEGGADDYVVKPFNMREVLHRTRVVLERYRGLAAGSAPDQRQSTGRYQFEAGTLNVGRRELIDPRGSRIDLTDGEFDLLTIFLSNPTRILSRDELSLLAFKRSWSPLERAVDNHIAKLRKKIEPEGEAPQLIKSVRGVGYVFAGDVRQL